MAAIVEVATGEPGMSLVDGYWIGRLPWTPIGVGMALFGATAAASPASPPPGSCGGRPARVVGYRGGTAGRPLVGLLADGPGSADACCGRTPA